VASLNGLSHACNVVTPLHRVLCSLGWRVFQPQRVLMHLGLSLVVYREAVLGQRQPPRAHAIDVRFTGLKPSLPLANLKSSMVNKLVSITGYVVRVSSIQPLATRASFECPKCGAMVLVWFEDGKFTLPSRCYNSSCRAKSFELRRDTAVTVDYQKVKIQETDNSLAEAGRVPRTVEVELVKGLVDSCIPGDLVTIVGVVNSVKSDHAAGKAAKGKAVTSLYVLYLAANSVLNNRSSQGPAAHYGKRREVRSLRFFAPNLHCPGGSYSSTTPHRLAHLTPPLTAISQAPSSDQASGQFTAEDLHAIRSIAHDDPFGRVVSSVCPSIFGLEHVKAGVTLGLFGGSKVGDFSQDRLAVRSDPHVLVVGDPGLGKSQMLRAAATVAPRSVYCSANTTTASGMTVRPGVRTGASTIRINFMNQGGLFYRLRR